MSETAAWVLALILAPALALPLALAEHRLTALDFLAPPPPLAGRRPAAMPLAFTPALPAEDYLAFLRPEPALLEDVRGQAGSRPFSETMAVYESVIEAAAHRHQVSPLLIKAVIQAESKYDPVAVSSKGAVGLMQVMPATGRALGVTNLKDPTMNIEAGAKYLRMLLTLYHDDERLAIAAYNCGPEALKRFDNEIPPFPETLAYVELVMEYYSRNLDG
jgi:soluble lytic murein transglycosylase-like protein